MVQKIVTRMEFCVITELNKLQEGTGKYEWDELEELITDAYEEEELTDEQFDMLMQKLMGIECE